MLIPTGKYRIEEKVFVCRDKSSTMRNMFLRKLTPSEFNFYKPGVAIEGYIDVIGFGYFVAKDETGEEWKINCTFNGNDPFTRGSFKEKNQPLEN